MPNLISSSGYSLHHGVSSIISTALLIHSAIRPGYSLFSFHAIHRSYLSLSKVFFLLSSRFFEPSSGITGSQTAHSLLWFFHFFS